MRLQSFLPSNAGFLSALTSEHLKNMTSSDIHLEYEMKESCLWVQDDHLILGYPVAVIVLEGKSLRTLSPA